MSGPMLEAAAALIADGQAAAARKDYAAAVKLLEQAVCAAETQNSRVTAYLELGKAFDLLSKRRSAQACYRRIMSLTDDWTYRDQARRLFRRAFRG